MCTRFWLVSFLFSTKNCILIFYDIEPLVPNIQVTNSPENEPAGYGSVCSISRDCQQAAIHLECLHGICVCSEGYVPLGKYLCYNIHGQGNKFKETYTIIWDIF